jgi:hypothetical protein
VREPSYTGVKVKARIVPQDFFQPAEVQQRVVEELKRYITPLPVDDKAPLFKADETWEGWQFGRDLFAAEIISLIQQIPLVKYVLDVEIHQRSVIPVEETWMYDEAPKPELFKVENVLMVPDDGLLCSLDHEVEIVNIQDLYKKG